LRGRGGRTTPLPPAPARQSDPPHHGREVRQHLVIPEANHADLLVRQSFSARLIPFTLLFVDGPVQLNAELPRGTVEIKDESPAGVLTTKVQSGNLVPTQRRPEHFLRLRHRPAQLFRCLMD
ncbi:MAG TPA: hypothetical protein VFY65_20130, partial [Longimicrobium sp.]|nr:hypothetical protein [Longimicrobium sp.]